MGRTDYAHDETTKKIERLKKRLAKEYKQAQKELQKQYNVFVDEFDEKFKRKMEDVKKGIITAEQANKWVEAQMLRSDILEQQVAIMSQHLANVDKQAANIINGTLPEVYAMNYNYARYEVEKGFHINTSFSLFDKRTVERLARDNPRLLPEVDPDEDKGKRWSKRKINNVITQGVLQGQPLDKIAKGLIKVTEMSWHSAVRNARTAMTGAQNAGRIESYKNAQELGINLRKQWMATLDERTRTSHQYMDGEAVPVDKKFSNKLKYPGDPDGKPAEVYNCRCTLVAALEDFPSDKFQRLDNIEKKPINNVTFLEWAKSKQIPVKPKPSKDSKIQGVTPR